MKVIIIVSVIVFGKLTSKERDFFEKNTKIG